MHVWGQVWREQDWPCGGTLLAASVQARRSPALPCRCLAVPATVPSHAPLPCLQAAAAQLFPLYVQPLREGRQMQSRQLHARISGEVHQRLQVLALQQQHAGAGAAAGLQPAAAADDGGDAAAADQRTAAGRKASCCGLSFELPYVSKFLLLAAHVASRNKPTSDRAVFDPTYRKRGRKDAQAHDRQVRRRLAPAPACLQSAPAVGVWLAGRVGAPERLPHLARLSGPAGGGCR